MTKYIKKKLYFLAFSISLLALISACTRLPNIQGNGEAVLQGVWNQDTVANAEQLLNFTQHKFKFSCDSFYVDLTTHSKVNYYEEACYHNGIWKEYAKGTYVVSGDTLFLKGTFTKANYKQKVSGCFRNGQYISNFKLKSIGASKMILESLNDQKECRLILKAKINCVPKQL